MNRIILSLILAVVLSPSAKAEVMEDRLHVWIDGCLGFIDLSGNLLFLTDFTTYDDGLPGEPQWTEGFLWVGRDTTNAQGRVRRIYDFIDVHGKALTGRELSRYNFMKAPEFKDGYAYVRFEGQEPRNGIIDTQGRVIAIWHQRYVPFYSGFSDGLHPLLLSKPNEERLFAYVNTSGRIAIDGPFQAVQEFRNGRAWVREGGKWGIIDTNGQFVLPPRFAAVDWQGTVNGCTWVSDSGSLWGLIDDRGKYLIRPQFEQMDASRGGLTMVMSGGCWGLVNRDGEMRVPTVYDRIEPVYQEVTLWKVSIDDRWGLITSEGQTVCPVEFKRIHVRDGLVHVERNGLHGLIDIGGRVVVEPKYDFIFPYSEGPFEFRQDGRCGYMSWGGDIVVEPKYNECWSFHEGRAVVQDENGKWGIIDEFGEYLISPKYDGIGWPHRYGLTAVYLGKRGDPDRRSGVIDMDGNIVIPIEYDSASPVRPGIVSLRRCGRTGYLKLPDTWIWGPSERWTEWGTVRSADAQQ